jgi:eukaryotic-like serine/threonine-protein kinase
VTGLAALQADDPPRVGSYVLLGRLGSGGMGRVYLARSPGGRQVAVKVIRPALAEDAAFRARFAREVAAARKVGGLYTAQVVDADLNSPVPWLVTAYVPGLSLDEAVSRQGPLPAATVLALAAGLAEGLTAIHRAGVIHRDLKPSNVLLAPDGPRIIDFGIASAVDATSLTGANLMVGSPGFMSPEQAEGLPVGPASDMFSLAGVLTFAARGQGPFGTGDTAALLYRVVHGTPNLDQLPDQIRPLVSRCLSRDPRLRPTAAAFLGELTAVDPSAADLTGWLPARLLQISAQDAAMAGASASAGYTGPAGHTGLAGNTGSAGNTGLAGHGPAAPPLAAGGQRYPPPEQPETRRRTRWAWAAGAAAVLIAGIAVAVVLSLGPGHPAPGSGSPAGQAAGTGLAVGSLQLGQMRVGDCLTGSDMDLNTSNPWPKLTRAVPCNQAHTAEVFLADEAFWAKQRSFPGSAAISKEGNAACNTAFRGYVGIGYSKSIYTWTNIIPDAATWPAGDRALHCIAYYATSSQPAGATLTHSVKDSRK